MTTHTTLPPASKSLATEPSAFSQCDDASCAFERMMILLDTITEVLRTANDDMPAGDGKDRAHYDVFCLLLLLHDNMKAHGKALSEIQATIASERRAA